jgi:hypothetical protein
MNDELKQLLAKPTASVPEVGRICFGLARNASYAAAKSGQIPTVKMGGKIRAVTAPLARMLGIEVKG